MSHVDDYDNVARFYSHPIGSFYLGLDGDLDVNYAVREYTQNVYQLVGQFGLDNVSPQIRSQYDKGNYGVQVAVVNHLMPNLIQERGNPFALGKPYLGVYYEAGMNQATGFGNVGTGATKNDNFLKIEGFSERPFYAPRWAVLSEDTYATQCPGMIALCDVK